MPARRPDQFAARRTNMTLPLMPKATAVWLIENTTLTFEQVAVFCGLHPLEVKGIADGEVATGIVGLDPTGNGQLARDEIARGEADPNVRLEMAKTSTPIPKARTRGARYTPVSKRQDRPDAIAWIVKFHPEISDAQIQKLLGTTKTTIGAVRDRSHWNHQNIKPRDPVSLGICSQMDLDRTVAVAQKKKAGRDKPNPKSMGATVVPRVTAHQPAPAISEPVAPAPAAKEPDPSLALVFGTTSRQGTDL
jgi:hypothetical protein